MLDYVEWRVDSTYNLERIVPQSIKLADYLSNLLYQ